MRSMIPRGEANRPEFSVRSMCCVLAAHFSGFYAWLKNPLSQRAQEDVHQTELIQQVWADSGKVYGYPLAVRASLCDVPRGAN